MSPVAVATFLALLGAVAFTASLILVVMAGLVGGDARAAMRRLVSPYALGAALVVAVTAMSGSLYFSEVARLEPCVLCWYQRIAMFPLAIVLAVGLFPYDARVVRYGLPLAAAGALLALYHLGLVAGWIPESSAPCRQGLPCSDPQVVWLGFVTIPLLALAAFVAIAGLLLAAHFKDSQ